MRIDFNLNRCVPDGEMLMQFMREPNQKLVAGMAARHEAVTSQGCISCAHWPDMQVMNCRHTRLLQKKRLTSSGLISTGTASRAMPTEPRNKTMCLQE